MDALTLFALLLLWTSSRQSTCHAELTRVKSQNGVDDCLPSKGGLAGSGAMGYPLSLGRPLGWRLRCDVGTCSTS